ncbi:MAG: four helix bundle protein [Verrucomicrobiota bacterium]
MQSAKKDFGERTFGLARAIVRLYSSLPKATLPQVLGKQVLRSGTSVGANYAEADAARSKAEFRAKLGVCHSELSETAYWLRLLSAEQIVDPAKLERLQQEVKELIAIVITILRNSA